MPEKIDNKTIYSLFEIAGSIRAVISQKFNSVFWIKAEMIRVNYYSKSGHCYPDMVEKREGRVIAQMRSNLWKDDYIRINNNFQQVIHEPLKDGIKILFLAKVSFDPVYGLALRIIDIDPGYTLGDLEKEKQEAIKKLKEEGIFNANKALKLPLLPKRIAIISVETSKGYRDFIAKTGNNPWGYRFFHMLFPSVLQGDQILQSITAQLNRIRKVRDHFDAIAIIRGGGGDLGLSSYNNYLLAREIALFPVPVITGIGHSTNETVVEMVAHRNLITPTDLADFLIQMFHNFSVPVSEAQKTITHRAIDLIEEEKSKFRSEVKLFRSVTENILIRNKNEVAGQVRSLAYTTQTRFRNEKDTISFILDRMKQTLNFQFTSGTDQIQRIREKLGTLSAGLLKTRTTELVNTEKNVSNMDPANVLKRGYSITLYRGKAIKSTGAVNPGEILETLLHDGKISSIVKSSNKQKEK